MEGKRPITIKNIAQKFHCSPSTVSRALNDHPAINIDTRKHIQKYAREMDYQRNLVSLGLLHHKSFTIGVIVPKIIGYFEASVIDGIQSILEPSGYILKICLTRESFDAEVRSVDKLLCGSVDGVFVSVSSETIECPHFEKIQQRGIPLIFIDRDYAGIDAHKVMVDDYTGAFKAVEHLVQIGCKRIAHLKGPTGLSVSEHRLNGYLDALKKQNIPIDEDLIITSGFKTDRGIFPTQRLLELPNPPDGIFAVNDNVAIGAMHVIKERGLSIPDEIAVVGFDNDPHSAYFFPSLTTVAQPSFELGAEAAHLFLNHANQEVINKFENIILPPELIIRGSSLRNSKAAHPH